MEPNHQLFGHYLRSRMEMQRGMTGRHYEKTSGYRSASGMRAAIGKLLKSLVRYYRRPTTNAEPEILQHSSRRSQGHAGKGSAL
ncbi:hypothetical protein Krac_1716 [Ktedonobacter racemifer DSM 44963]|uniref:Uncharacterized protein n=1 Tax=Ktedonobacter racemifer DSM 44963 TaxID=485913 RepID=D6U342_KTERA|nr:hypothetical protein Krac_1716 [Ktedonobacter racemifer DSM 44963]